MNMTLMTLLIYEHLKLSDRRDIKVQARGNKLDGQTCNRNNAIKLIG